MAHCPPPPPPPPLHPRSALLAGLLGPQKTEHTRNHRLARKNRSSRCQQSGTNSVSSGLMPSSHRHLEGKAGGGGLFLPYRDPHWRDASFQPSCSANCLFLPSGHDLSSCPALFSSPLVCLCIFCAAEKDGLSWAWLGQYDQSSRAAECKGGG